MRSVRVRLVIPNGDALLLIPKGDRHVLPGGGLEFGETVEQAAVREAAEELGRRVSLEREIAVIEHTFREQNYREHFVLVRLGEEIPAIDRQQTEWVPAATWRSTLLPPEIISHLSSL